MYNDKIRNTYSIFKDNLSVILLVPTVLGGIWQLLELSTMSTSFIRFFSLSQLIADGLLILFVSSIFYISYRIVGHSFSKNLFKLNIENPMPLSYGIVSLALIVIVLFFLYPELKQAYYKKNISIPEITLMIPVLTMIIGGLLNGLLSILENLISRNRKNIVKLMSVNWLKAIFKIIYPIIAVIVLIGFIKIIFIDLGPHFSNLRQRVLFPDQLLNKEILDKKIILEHHLKYKPSLKYYNDKYFFYEILDEKKNKKILIVDFSALIYK